MEQWAIYYVIFMVGMIFGWVVCSLMVISSGK